MSLTVVQTLPALEVGGVEKGTLEVAAELVRRGHRSIVVSAGGRLVDKLVSEGSEHIEWSIGKKSPMSLRYIKPLRRLLEKKSVNILHTRSRLPAWISYLAWKGMNKETRPHFVTTVHGPYTVNAYSKVMTMGEEVIAISQFIKDYILNNYKNADANKITIIYRGVSSSEFPYKYSTNAAWLDSWRSSHPDLENKFVLTSPARITRWKGQEDFLKIIAGLKKLGLPIHGLIAGAPHPRRMQFLSELKILAENLGISEQISFIGHRDDIKEVMSISSVALSLAKEPEAFGRTALEALSLGVPVIAYDHGGATEVLKPVFPQGLIPPHDIESAIKRIKQFYDKEETVPAQHEFTLENMLDSTINLYEKVASQT